MPLFYRVRRDNRVDSDHLYYGKAVQTNVVGTDDLAETIQRNCSMKKSDVVAVLTELVEVMTEELQNSNTVRLEGFGSFRLSVKSIGAETEESFSASKNITGIRCRFLPEGRKDISTNKVQRIFTNGCKLQKYAPEKPEKK